MSNLQDFLSPETFSYPVNQRVETDIIFPVSKNQNAVRFVFDQKGILDSNSKVRLKLLVPQVAGAEPNAYLPINTGCSSLISRAWLEIGGRRVSTLESVGGFNTFMNLSYSPEYSDGIQKVLEGVVTKIGGSEAIGGGVTGLIGKTPSDNIADPYTAFIPQGIKLKSTSALSPEFSIPISRLVPMLKGLQLPLFAINEEVSLTIEFKQGEARERFCQRSGEATGGVSTIDVDNCILMADFLYYPDDMDDIAQKIASPNGFSILYDEVIVVKATENAIRPAGPAIGAGLHLPTTFTQQIALAGKTLKSILVQSFKVGNNIEGNYVSNDDNIEDAYNFVIDSRPYYAQDVVNTSFKYNEVGKVLDRNLSLNSSQYAFINQVSAVVGNAGGAFAAALSGFTDYTLEGYTQKHRTATQRWLGVALSNRTLGVGGKVLSNLPILFRRNRQIMNDAVYPSAVPDYQQSVNLTFYCITQNMLLLKNGLATISQ